MTIPKTDLLHYYRALKLLRDIIRESPELVNDEEEAVFLLAWTIIGDTQIKEYDYDAEEE